MSNIIIGCRIPNHYFVTKGKGESDITVHAGSFHLALLDADIECYNIMSYSSIMPGTATEVPKPEKYDHGAVLETIMAVATTKSGERCTAGIIIGWLFNKKTKQKYGGLVCEHNGSYTLEEIEVKLRASLNELYQAFKEDYDLSEIRIMTESFTPQKENGTALVAIGFVDYIVPVVG